jgi:hypothetical protein
MNQQILPNTVAKSSVYDKKSLDYIIGKGVIPDGFNDNRKEQCGQGIHFHVYPEYCHYWEKSNDFKVSTKQPPIEKVEADGSTLSSLFNWFNFTEETEKLLKEKDE